MFGDHPRTSIASVVSEADTAMYAAKDDGRDGVRVFDPVAIRDDAPEAPSRGAGDSGRPGGFLALRSIHPRTSTWKESGMPSLITFDEALAYGG